MPSFYPLTVSDIRRETADCVSVAFTVPDHLQREFAYLPGQYLTLRTTLNGAEVRRSYSLCTSPLEHEWRVAIKRVPGGQFSAYAHEGLQVGDVLEAMPPEGRFTVPLAANHHKHYVAFAAGSGITPVMSLLKSVLGAEPHSRFTLFYGNKTTDSIIFHEELEALKNVHMGRLSVHHVLSRERLGSELFAGRIDGAKCQAFCQKLLDTSHVDEFFLCGPEEMIHTVRDTLLAAGVDRKRIHLELFGSGAALAEARKRRAASHEPDILTTVQLTLDGNTIDFSLHSRTESILDAALRHGANLPYACKGGVCCTCRAKLLVGEVEMDVNYALEPDEVAAGYILTCQSHPRTDQIVVSFDD